MLNQEQIMEIRVLHFCGASSARLVAPQASRVDAFGYLPFDRHEAVLLFQVIAKRD